MHSEAYADEREKGISTLVPMHTHPILLLRIPVSVSSYTAGWGEVRT